MSEEEFLGKFGYMDADFIFLDGFTVAYRNDEFGFICSGKIDHRDVLLPVEKVQNLYNLENFYFQFLNTNNGASCSD